MHKTEIGANAGKVWRALREKKSASMQELSGMLGLSVEDVAFAAGWLARENNIFIQKEGDSFRISDEEENIMFKF